MSPIAFPAVTVLLGDPRLPDRTKPNQRYTPEDLEAVERLREALARLSDYHFEYRNDHEHLVQEMHARRPQFVLNFCDTGYRNEARRELHLPALLELLSVPYSGTGPVGIGLCYDKSLVRAIAARHKIPVPEEIFLACDEAIDSRDLPLPALIKPNSSDGSFGITAQSVVREPRAARDCIERLRRQIPGGAILIQEYLEGTEYSIGLIGNPGAGFAVLPELEVDYSGLPENLPRILAYESKVDPKSPYWTEIRYRRAAIDEQTRARLVRDAGVLFERLQCRDYARVDFRADRNGEIKLMEINPNPAWCWDGKLNLMAGFEGRSYADLLKLIIDTAQARASTETA